MTDSHASQPRISASYEIEPHTLRETGTNRTITSPMVDLCVTFDFGDSEAALAALDEAAAEVRAQIMETQ